MAWPAARPGVQLRLPLRPAITPPARDRERLDRPVSGRYRELFASGAERQLRPQGLEFADSTTVATCAVFAVLPRSGFPRRQPRRNTEDVVIPFRLPCLQSIATSLTK